MPDTAKPSLFFGLTFGWTFALASFVLTVTGCLPLAWLFTMHISTLGRDHGHALMVWLPIMALVIAVACGFLYRWLRQRPEAQRSTLLGMWTLSVFGMAGWWML